jgi:hypothetical protein
VACGLGYHVVVGQVDGTSVLSHGYFFDSGIIVIGLDVDMGFVMGVGIGMQSTKGKV